MEPPMATLKEAIKKKKLKQFILEHPSEGDREKFGSTLSSMVGRKSKAGQAASVQVASGRYAETQTPQRKKKGT